MEPTGASGTPVGALRHFSDFDLDHVDAVVAEWIKEGLLAESQIRTCEMRLKRAFAESRSHIEPGNRKTIDLESSTSTP